MVLKPVDPNREHLLGEKKEEERKELYGSSAVAEHNAKDDRAALSSPSSSSTLANVPCEVHVNEEPGTPGAYYHPDEEPMSPSTEHKTLRFAFFTMFPMFMGYASLVTLQSKIKHRLDIGDNGTAASYEFSFATSLLYLGNLIFRLMHNVLFSFIRPRYRVVIAYVCMTLAVGMLGIVYYVADSKSLLWVYVAYIMGGVAIGTFESNLISVITPLGHGTKVWAQLGIPLGFNGISVGAFALFSAFPDNLRLQMGVYLFVTASNFAGLIFFLVAIPDIPFESTHKTLTVFWADLKQYKKWAPRLWKHAFALCIDMFALGFNAAIQLYIYDASEIPLWLGANGRIPENAFRVVFNLCSLVGDATGRKLAYWTKKHHNPLYFLFFTVLGTGLVLSKQAIVAPIGMWCVMFANGSIYAHTTKYVDDEVDRAFNLISLSFWLFVGDIGSFTGANAVNPVRVLVGSV